MESGIYKNMTDAEYREIDLPSKSSLAAQLSPNGSKINRGVAEVGSLFHHLILRPDDGHGDTVYIERDKAVRRGSKAWEANQSEHSFCVRESEFDLVTDLIRKVAESPYKAVRDAAVKGDTEVVVVADVLVDDSTLKCKGMIDQIYNGKSGRWLVDWKTTSAVLSDEFDTVGFAYDAQAWLYSELARLNGIEFDGFALICVSKRSDNVWLHRFTDEELKYGKRICREWMRLWKMNND